MTRYHAVILSLTGLLIGCSVLSLCGHLPPQVRFGQGMIDFCLDRDSVSALIIGQLRLPRFLLAFLIGSALGLSGANLQAVTRNPLADPGLLGITGCASLGAVLIFYTGILPGISWAMPMAAFICALFACFILLMVSYNGVTVMTLAGVALGTVSVALLSLILNLVPSPYARFEITHWLLGSLNHIDFQDVLIASPGLVLGCLLLLATGRNLNGLSLGEDVAFSMGINLQRTQLFIICGCALSLGAAVAVAGNIGFIGLIVPHIVRFLVGYTPSRSLIPSALLGASLLVGADAIVRSYSSDSPLPLGVVTTLIGTPFFLFQIWKLRQDHNV